MLYPCCKFWPEFSHNCLSFVVRKPDILIDVEEKGEKGKKRRRNPKKVGIHNHKKYPLNISHPKLLPKISYQSFSNPKYSTKIREVTSGIRTKTDKLLEILPMAIFHGKLDLASETKLPTGITLKVLQSEQG